MMRVWLIHLAEMLVTDPSGRPWRYGMLARALTARGHRVVQWAPTFIHYTRQYRAEEDRLISPSTGYEIQLVHAGSYTNNVSLKRIRFQTRMARRFSEMALQRDPPDLILVSMPTPSMCEAALSFGRTRGIPVLVDVRDLWPDAIIDLFPRPLRGMGRLLLFPMKSRNRRLFRLASGITAISNTYLEWGLDFARRPRGVTDGWFPMGYSPPQLSEDERKQAEKMWKEHGVTGSDLTCCFFGTMGRQYWLQDVIRAAAALPDIKFVFCGDGDNRGRYQREARRLPNVLFPGWVSSEEVASLMSLSQIGLAPYRGGAQMSLPNKPFEYMAGGLPVVSSLRGELRELLERKGCGLSYQAGEVPTLVAALRRLQKDPALRARMGSSARELFETSFRAETIYGEMSRHLESVVAARRLKPPGES